MKTIFLIIVFELFCGLAFSQYYILNMSDVYETDQPHGNYWCWVRATKNTMYYYGIDYSNSEIPEYARSHNYIPTVCPTNDCNVDPGCCDTTSFGCEHNILYYMGDISSGTSTTKTSNFLYSQFIQNKPVIIISTGHSFVAYGINGNKVYILDGFYSETTIDNIYPNRTWLSTIIMNHSPNCSSENYITGFIDKPNELKASNTIYASCEIQCTGNLTLQSNNSIQLRPGFKVQGGNTNVIMQTGQNYCP